jgi:cobalt-precorrin-7 (C5)-methyltransferase
MEMTNKKITIVGCGPGSADYITPAAAKAVENAEVLVGAKRLLELFGDSKAEQITVTGHIEDVLDKIQAACETKTVAVLVSGDPGIFSLAKTVNKRFGRANCITIPAVSSLQMAFAKIGLDWADAKIISAHHKLPDIEKLNLDEYSKIAILLGRKDAMDWLIGLVKQMGEAIEIFAFENLTLENETIRKIDPNEIESVKLSSRTIVILIKKEAL